MLAPRRCLAIAECVLSFSLLLGWAHVAVAQNGKGAGASNRGCAKMNNGLAQTGYAMQQPNLPGTRSFQNPQQPLMGQSPYMMQPPNQFSQLPFQPIFNQNPTGIGQPAYVPPQLRQLQDELYQLAQSTTPWLLPSSLTTGQSQPSGMPFGNNYYGQQAGQMSSQAIGSPAPSFVGQGLAASQRLCPPQHQGKKK
jgi:hypothetical protein